MDTSVLENIGLSPVEIKIFLTVLELGETKAGRIIEKSNLQSSSVYNAINKLISKGLVSYIKRGQVKFYQAADPETIVDYIELKKREYLKLLPELKSKQIKGKEEGVEFFRSFRGIKTIFLIMLKDAKKGDIYRTFSIDNPELYETSKNKVFKAVKQIIKEKKIIPMGIFHEKTRSKPTKNSIIQKRYVDFPTLPTTIMMNNKIAIISWTEEPSGILIHSKEIYDSYIKFFDYMWKIAKR